MSSPPDGVDAYAFHEGKINHEAALADRFSSDAVASTPNRNNKIVLPRKTDTRYDISGSCTACDDRRSSINHRVRNGACGVVSVLARTEYWPAHHNSQSINRGKINHVILRKRGTPL